MLNTTVLEIDTPWNFGSLRTGPWVPNGSISYLGQSRPGQVSGNSGMFICLHGTGQLFLPVEQAHNALKGSDMIGSADSRSHVNDTPVRSHVGTKSIWCSWSKVKVLFPFRPSIRVYSMLHTFVKIQVI